MIVMSAMLMNNEGYAAGTPNPIQAGDTTAFSPNTEEGWLKLSSYSNAKDDSTQQVVFEVILKRMQTPDWSKEHLIGVITNEAYLPANDLEVDYYLLKDNIWTIRITAQGSVHVRMKEGGGPLQSPVILPLKVAYRLQEN